MQISELEGGLFLTPLQAAAFKGDVNTIRLLLDAGAEVNVSGGQFGSALHAVAFQGHENVVRILLSSGADTHLDSIDWGTPILAAAYSRRKAVVRILFEQDAKASNSGEAAAEIFTKRIWVLYQCRCLSDS